MEGHRAVKGDGGGEAGGGLWHVSCKSDTLRLRLFPRRGTHGTCYFWDVGSVDVVDVFGSGSEARDSTDLHVEQWRLIYLLSTCNLLRRGGREARGGAPSERTKSDGRSKSSVFWFLGERRAFSCWLLGPQRCARDFFSLDDGTGTS